MFYFKYKFIILSIFFSFFLNNTICFSEGLNLSVNPLITYQEQLKQIRKECRAAGFPPECEKRISALEKEQEKLQDYCTNHSYDKRCDSVKRKSRTTVNTQEEYCAENPDTPQCGRRRERKRITQRYMLRFCRLNPENPRCRPKLVYKRKEPYMEKFCRENPQEKKCIIFNERSGKAVKRSDSDQPNTF